MTHPFRSRLGFTLIEMSVVLVIIAFVVGGVLVGQEMVHTGELNSIASDVNRIKSGTANFRLKYNYWPGDMPNATSYWSTTANGNGDGRITETSWLTTGEIHLYWQHMGLAQMITGNYSGATSSNSDVTKSVVPGLNMMAAKTGGFYEVAYDNTSNALQEGHRIGMWGGNPSGAALPPADIKEIDTKTDDSRPMTGMVTNHPVSLGAGCYTTSDPTTSDYIVSTVVPVCWPQFWIGAE